MIDYYFSFRSPYSYLSGPRAFALPERYAVEINFRGVIPMAMRGQSVPRAKRLNTLRDVDREAKRLGMPFGQIYDPIGDGALRCLAVSEFAKDAGRAAEFVLAASKAIWAEAVDVSSDQGLRTVCEKADLGWAGCHEAIGDESMAERFQRNTDALAELGHWGVPVFDFDGELFWGQDRIQDLDAALAAAGLAQPEA